MRRPRAATALGCALALVAVACSGTTGGTAATPGGAGPARGGTLHVGLTSDVTHALDPTREYYTEGWSLLHVMLRNLMSYRSVLGATGDVPVPDLAVAPPAVSNDSTVWEFTLRPGVKFGPPLDREIVCADIQTAFQRAADPAVALAYPGYYEVIKGWNDFYAGTARTISGITCLNQRTVRFELTQPTGDFAYRVSLPATAPLPAEAIKGHNQDYGRYLVASGCYMFQGEDQVNFGLPLKDQEPAAGYQPGKSIVLVRNPDWSQATDPLRTCYLNEIDLTIGGDVSDLMNKVQAGQLDYVDDNPMTAEALRAFRADPTLSSHVGPPIFEDSTYYIWMNLTVPPFDDIHVRKAVNWIVNKDAMLRIRGGPDFGTVATHIVPPSMAGALPAAYDPYATPSHQGSLAKAEAEMKLSKYDPQQDGKCDVAQCKDVFMVSDSTSPLPEVVQSLTGDLAKIGITAKDRALETGTMYNFYETPAKKIAIGPTAAWVKDYADQLTFLQPLFDGRTIHSTGNVNSSMVNDPTLNAKIDTCSGLAGDQRGACWGDVDRYLMQSVVPWVPWRWGVRHFLFSTRVAQMGYSQFTTGSAYDAVALTPQAIQQG